MKITWRFTPHVTCCTQLHKKVLHCPQCLLYKNVSTCDYRARAPKDVWHSPWDGSAVGTTRVWLACSPSSLGISPLWTGCTAWTGESHGTAPGVCGPSLGSSALFCSCLRSPDRIQWAGPPICNITHTWQCERHASYSAICVEHNNAVCFVPHRYGCSGWLQGVWFVLSLATWILDSWVQILLGEWMYTFFLYLYCVVYVEALGLACAPPKEPNQMYEIFIISEVTSECSRC
jgi:hypothetical protein